jgi:hypothetical protein
VEESGHLVTQQPGTSSLFLFDRRLALSAYGGEEKDPVSIKNLINIIWNFLK